MAPPRQASQTLPPSKARAAAQLRKITRAPPAAKVNTALSAHPRTDPVSALGVLLRLLASLPSRIGGCQYKLTQAEHALALHLVGVLDPYVYHGVRALAPPSAAGSAASASCFGLVHQPTEILDAILFHVDARRDLLSVGLACKRLHDVVFPRHFDYRVIRCKVSSISVWNHLILHRSLARNVRRVEIVDERASASGVLVPRGILQGDTDLESTDDELTMHAKQERFLAIALVRMTGLREFKWSCNHSPISIAHVWPTLMMRAVNLKSINICNNLVFSPRTEQEEHDDSSDESESDADEGQRDNKQTLMQRVPAIALPDMESVAFRSTPHVYGSSKNPELGRIAAMLHQCMNLRDLEVTYIAPRTPSGTAAAAAGNSTRPRPLADEFLTYGRWSNLTTLALVNLRCGSYTAPSAFLSLHPALEVLHLDLSVHVPPAVNGNSGGLVLAPGALPRLREIKASKEIVSAILACPSGDGEAASSSSPPANVRRPLESIKGFKLSGTSHTPGPSTRVISDTAFLAHLREYAGTVKRVEMVGWHDMEDVKKLIASVPGVQYLDIGRRLGAQHHRTAAAGAERERDKEKGSAGPVANIIEWTELLATLPELVTLHGVKFFYELASAPVSSHPASASWSGALSSTSNAAGGTRDAAFPPPTTTATVASAPAKQAPSLHMSMMERSRMRKNDETAGVLAWKCRKLRRVDHWEEGGGRVIVLMREHGEDAGGVRDREGKVRWEVRRVR